MDWAVLLLVAVVAVLLLFVIYVVTRGGEVAKETAWDTYGHSGGGFDEAARDALEQVAATAEPTPGEHLLAATVLRRNVLDETPRQARTRREARQRAQERARLHGQTRRHYAAILDGVGRGARVDAPGIGLGFVLDEIAGFAFGGLAEFLGGVEIAENGWLDDERLIALHPELLGFGPLDGVLAHHPELLGFDFPLATAAAQAREELVQERRDAAAQAANAEGGARGAAVGTYVELATQHTADPQNTHDTGVMTCLKAALGRLRADQAGLRVPSPDDVVADIKRDGTVLSGGRPDVVTEAVATAQKAKLGEAVSGLGATEAECLGRVWLRADDPRNAAVRGKLRQAVFDALVDAWELKPGGVKKIACANGRSTRYLSALVLVDWDERNWTVKKLEQFKNDIFELTRGVIAAEAGKAAGSDDKGRAGAGKLYLAHTAAEVAAAGDVPEAAVTALEDDLRAAINKTIDEYLAALAAEMDTAEPIPHHVVETTRMEALAAIV